MRLGLWYVRQHPQRGVKGVSTEQARSGRRPNSDEHHQRNMPSFRTPTCHPTPPYSVGLLTVPHNPTAGGVVTVSPHRCAGEVYSYFQYIADDLGTRKHHIQDSIPTRGVIQGENKQENTYNPGVKRTTRRKTH